MFLSIVIPVYNGANTIKRCLDSIWRQNLPENEYEVICVDDCSTDDSISVLNEIAVSHSQLRILKNPENLRAGGARNHGVREANGEYILFIDADDYFYPDGLNKAYKYQKEKRLDILMMDMSRQYHIGDNPNLTMNFPNHDIMDGKSFILKNSCPFGPTKYVFRKNLMIENGVWFEENCCCEDVDWCLRLTLLAKKIQYLPEILEVYLQNPSGTTSVEHIKFKTVSDKMFAAKRLYEISLDSSLPKLVKDYIVKVGMLYVYEALKYMTSSYAQIALKSKWIGDLSNCYTPPLRGDNLIVKVAFKYPYLYSLSSNIMSIIVPHIIYFKRLIKNR